MSSSTTTPTAPPKKSSSKSYYRPYNSYNGRLRRPYSTYYRRPFSNYTYKNTYNNIPSAEGTTKGSYFKSYSNGNNMTVIGKDLVYASPGSSVSNTPSDGAAFAIIPANPCYWSGTRIAQVAAGFQHYKPVKLSFEYVPQVATTQSGTVYMGTLWDTAVPDSALQQSLLSSNGGMSTQVYNGCVSNVHLSGNLPQSLFECGGNMSSQKANPFQFIAVTSGAGDVVPGYFYVSYEYVLHNPIGAGKLYQTVNHDPASNFAFALPLITALTKVVAIGTGVVTLVKSTVEFIKGIQKGIGTLRKISTSQPANTNLIQLLDEDGNVELYDPDTLVYLYLSQETVDSNPNPNPNPGTHKLYGPEYSSTSSASQQIVDHYEGIFKGPSSPYVLLTTPSANQPNPSAYTVNRTLQGVGQISTTIGWGGVRENGSILIYVSTIFSDPSTSDGYLSAINISFSDGSIMSFPRVQFNTATATLYTFSFNSCSPPITGGNSMKQADARYRALQSLNTKSLESSSLDEED